MISSCCRLLGLGILLEYFYKRFVTVSWRTLDTCEAPQHLWRCNSVSSVAFTLNTAYRHLGCKHSSRFVAEQWCTQ